MSLELQHILDRVELVCGVGDPEQGTACIMSLVALLAKEPHTDRPLCASPVIRAFAIPINDHMPTEVRGRLKPFAPRIMGTNDALDPWRAEVLIDALTEHVLPRLHAPDHTGHTAATSRFRRFWFRLGRLGLQRRIARLLSEAKRGERHSFVPLARATGQLLALCARDAQNKVDAEWYWHAAIGLLDRLCDIRGPAQSAAGQRIVVAPLSASDGRLPGPIGRGDIPCPFRAVAAPGRGGAPYQT
jgi:hypothetical protein